MSKGVNKVILVGNLGADPESRTFPDGGSVTNINVATSEKWKDKQTGEAKEATEWHRVVLRNKLGEIAAQYLRKGSKVYIEGRLQTRKWQDKQGMDRYTTEIVANEMQMLDSRNAGDDQQGAYQQNYQQQQPQTTQQPQQQQPPQQQPQGQPQSSQQPPAFNDFDDDSIPF